VPHGQRLLDAKVMLVAGVGPSMGAATERLGIPRRSRAHRPIQKAEDARPSRPGGLEYHAQGPLSDPITEWVVYQDVSVEKATMWR
jgi:hypothetical protein